MSWFSGFEAAVRADVPLGPLTAYKLGGPARWLCEPRDEPELSALLSRLRAAGIPWRVLGGGANVLVRDDGFNGAVIRLRGPVFERVSFDGRMVTAGAGADLPGLIQKTLRQGLVGLEALVGIPGTVGGAVRMNAGGRHGQIGDFVRQVRLLDPEGHLAVRAAADVGFAYRRSGLDGCIVVAVTLALRRGDVAQAEARAREILELKRASQPLGARSAGCIFKNPPGKSAWRLIEQVGLRGARLGGAQISSQHANFIVAAETATAADVLGLIRLAAGRVREQQGVTLEPEVDIW